MRRLEGKRAVLVVAHQGYREEELDLPRAALEAEGVQVRLACSSLAPADGMHGGRCFPDLLYSAVRVADLDALVFVGGTGAAEYFPDRTAHALISDAVAAGKVVGGMCFASSTLANAGVLDGREATGYPTREAHLRSQGALYADAPVARAGNIVTGRGPEDAQAFAAALVDALVTG